MARQVESSAAPAIGDQSAIAIKTRVAPMWSPRDTRIALFYLPADSRGGLVRAGSCPSRLTRPGLGLDRVNPVRVPCENEHTCQHLSARLVRCGIDPKPE